MGNSSVVGYGSIDDSRSQAWNSMVSALDTVRGGVPAVLHVEGPVGTGKSTLAFELIEVATDAGFIVSNACPSDRTFDGKPLVIDELFGAAEMSGRAGKDSVEPTDKIGQILEEVHNGRPTLAVVDNAQNTDSFSLEMFARVLVKRKSMLIVLVTTEGAVTAHPLELRTLVTHPRATAVRVSNLSRDEISDYVATELNHPDPDKTGAVLYDAAGGNPALLRALAYDSRRSASESDTEFIVRPGREYVHAVQVCLRKLDPAAMRIALALATVGSDLLTRYPQEAVGSAGQLIEVHRQTLADAGILDEYGRFRLDDAQHALLDLTGRADAAAVHYNVARAMYEAGDNSLDVATQLRAAMPVHEPWAVATLVDASDMMQHEGRHDQAIEFLELALHCSTDDNFKSIFRSRHASLAWQAGPSQLHRMLNHHRSSTDSHGTEVTIHSLLFLLWQGYFDELLAHLSAMSEPGATQLPRADLQLLRHWVTSTYPHLLPYFPEPAGTNRTPVAGSNAGTLRLPDRMRLESAKLLSSVLTGGRTDDTVERAEQVLERLTFSDSSSQSIEPAMYCVLALIYADELHAADAWSRRICSRPQVLNSPTWQAQAMGSRGLVALRRGDLREALDVTTKALRSLPPASWGVGVGAPLATLIEVRTRMGDLDGAAELLEFPVQPVMMETRFGLHYLIARGQYLLAAGRPRSALADFDYCGEFMSTWGIDVLGLAQWRLHSARAHIALGNDAEARKLVREQMLRIGGRPSRSRGFALRTAAMVSSLDHRKRLLTDACAAYEASGDRLGYADAMSELADCLASLGDRSQARQVAKRSERATRECIPDKKLVAEVEPSSTPAAVAPAVPAALVGEVTTNTASVTRLHAVSTMDAADNEPDAVLSQSETKVATLAAKGLTNREIARDLFVTVSTVEQHLTRTYRKLGLARRDQLDLSTVLGHAAAED